MPPMKIGVYNVLTASWTSRLIQVLAHFSVQSTLGLQCKTSRSAIRLADLQGPENCREETMLSNFLQSARQHQTLTFLLHSWQWTIRAQRIDKDLSSCKLHDQLIWRAGQRQNCMQHWRGTIRDKPGFWKEDGEVNDEISDRREILSTGYAYSWTSFVL